MAHEQDPAWLEMLRARADSRLDDDQSASADDATLHELRVHQEELHLQNHELQRANREIGGLRDLYRDLYEFAPVGYLTVDHRGAIATANLRAAQLLGVPRSKLPGRTLGEFVARSELRTLRTHLDRVFTLDRSQIAHLWGWKGDGTPVRLRLETLRSPADGGEPSTCHVALVDITDAYRARQALDRRTRQLDAIVSALPDAVITCGAKGTIATANPAAADLFGRPIEALRGQSIHGLLDEAHGLLSGDTSEALALRPDGSQAVVALRHAHMVLDDTPHHLLILEDLTERRLLEQENRQAQRMETLGRVATGIAHDFKNLLTGIQGACDLLQDRMSDDDPSQHVVDMVRTGTDRGAELLRQLLALARDEGTAPRPVLLDTVVADAQGMLQRLLGTSIALEVALCGDAGPVLAAPGHIDQVLLNLVLNARDAIDGSGRITVRTELVEPASGKQTSGRDAPARAVLSVRDTGHGMDAATRSQVFEPFFTTKGERGGTGLGLANVLRIVQQLDGDIHVDSAPGQGTAIRIHLPVVSMPRDVETPDEQPSPTDGAGRTVLLVESEPLVMTTAEHYLEQAGFQVITAVTPSEAVRLFEGLGEQVDAAVCDTHLEDASGAALAEVLREQRPELPVLLLTTAPVDDRQAVGAPPTARVEKPFTPQGLTDALGRLLQTRVDA